MVRIMTLYQVIYRLHEVIEWKYAKLSINTEKEVFSSCIDSVKEAILQKKLSANVHCNKKS
jgi:hypothetical protein